MEANGWVGRARSTDRRERVLRLTGEGRARLQAALPAWEEVQNRIDEAVG